MSYGPAEVIVSVLVVMGVVDVVQMYGESVVVVATLQVLSGVVVVTHVPIESVFADAYVVSTSRFDSFSISSQCRVLVIVGTVIHPFQREAFLRLLW